ncbi:hypothetical protein ARTHRO9AX_80174 [Arthrobacter sp. 9AX]|nr:hypothetical protein ARTHRO9AX_80174 [Arthrobacter sp. 9AX]
MADRVDECQAGGGGGGVANPQVPTGSRWPRCLLHATLVIRILGPCRIVICGGLVVNLFRDLALNVSGHRWVLFFISRHRPSLSGTRLAAPHTKNLRPPNYPGGFQRLPGPFQSTS